MLGENFQLPSQPEQSRQAPRPGAKDPTIFLQTLSLSLYSASISSLSSFTLSPCLSPSEIRRLISRSLRESTPFLFSLYQKAIRKEEGEKKETKKKPPNMQKRTPQNTPANNAPISSHAQQPGVSSIKEGKF